MKLWLKSILYAAGFMFVCFVVAVGLVLMYLYPEIGLTVFGVLALLGFGVLITLGIHSDLVAAEAAKTKKPGTMYWSDGTATKL